MLKEPFLNDAAFRSLIRLHNRAWVYTGNLFDSRDWDPMEEQARGVVHEALDDSLDRPLYSDLRRKLWLMFSIAAPVQEHKLCGWQDIRSDHLCSRIRDRMWEQLYSLVRDRVWEQAGNRTWEQAHRQVREPLWEPLWGRIGDPVWERVEDRGRGLVRTALELDSTEEV